MKDAVSARFTRTILLVLFLLLSAGCNRFQGTTTEEGLVPLFVSDGTCLMKYSISRDEGLSIMQGEDWQSYDPASTTESHFLGKIDSADATRLEKGEQQVLGVLKNKEVQPRELLQELLHEEKIRTYWHLDAELCLVLEENTADAYRAAFRGEHHYCTNDCYEEEFAFVFIIDWNSQKVFIVGV